MTQVATTSWPDRLLGLEDWEALPADELHHLECSEGVLFVTPKPSLRHQWAMVSLAQVLGDQLPGELVALADVEVLLTASPLTVRAPDVLVTHRSILRASPPRVQAEDVLLTVEIMSEGSRRTDRVTKKSEYAEAGLPEYWIVDLDDPVSLACHRLDAQGRFELAGEYRGAAELTACGHTVRLDLDTLSRP